MVAAALSGASSASCLKVRVDYPQAPRHGMVIVSHESSAADWDEYVHAHPSASAYHRWAWRSIFEDAFGHDTLYLSARECGQIVGVLPLVIFRRSLFGRFMVSLPFVNHGGALARDAAVAEMLLDSATAQGVQSGAAHLELRHCERLFLELPCRSHKVGMCAPLPAGVERAWASLDRKVRNQIRKAEKSDLRVSIGGAERIADFYGVFAENMRDLGTPVYPRRLFERVVEAFPRETRVVVVTHGTTAVAAGIGFGHRHTFEVPWASSLRAFRPACPNYLLYWAFLQQAIREGCTVFDFGRSTPGDGTYQFKLQWGATPQPLYWEYALLAGDGVPDRDRTSPKFSAAIDIWKRCPLWLTNALGPRIVRSLP